MICFLAIINTSNDNRKSSYWIADYIPALSQIEFGPAITKDQAIERVKSGKSIMLC